MLTCDPLTWPLGKLCKTESDQCQMIWSHLWPNWRSSTGCSFKMSSASHSIDNDMFSINNCQLVCFQLTMICFLFRTSSNALTIKKLLFITCKEQRSFKKAAYFRTPKKSFFDIEEKRHILSIGILGSARRNYVSKGLCYQRSWSLHYGLSS